MTQTHAQRIAEIKALAENDRHGKTPAVKAALKYLLAKADRLPMAVKECCGWEHIAGCTGNWRVSGDKNYKCAACFVEQALAAYEADEPKEE